LGCFTLLFIWGIVMTLATGGARLSGMSFGVQFFSFILAWSIWSSLNSYLARKETSRREDDPGAAYANPFASTTSPMEQALSAGQHQLALFFASARLGAHVARADGRIENEEIGVIGAYFSSLGWPQQSLGLLMVDLRHFVNLDDDETALTEAAHVVRRSVSSPSELEAVAFMVSMVACADGVLRRSEKHALEQIRLLLGLTAMQMDGALKSARASFRSARGGRAPQASTNTDHLETLGLSPGASQPEIRKAYLDLARKYHPDKVEHMGEEFRTAAEERFKSIQAAYEALRATGSSAAS
jgi:DnaJ like chaperone protein